MDFKPIKNPDEAKAIFREAKTNLSSTLVWTKNRTLEFHGHVFEILEFDGVLTIWHPKEVDPMAFEEALIRSSSREACFSVSLSGAHIFFKAYYLGFDSQGLRFQLPKEIFKIQRRTNFRMPIPDGQTIKVRYRYPLDPTKPIERKALNISAGGLAFDIESGDRILYSEGQQLIDFKFRIGHHEIATEAEVRHIRQSKDRTGKGYFVIGVQFKTLPARYSDAIAAYVFEESRKYYMKQLE